MATLRTSHAYRLVFYGNCRNSGKLRCHAYSAPSDGPASIQRALDQARQLLISPRFVSATRTSPARPPH